VDFLKLFSIMFNIEHMTLYTYIKAES